MTKRKYYPPRIGEYYRTSPYKGTHVSEGPFARLPSLLVERFVDEVDPIFGVSGELIHTPGTGKYRYEDWGQKS